MKKIDRRTFLAGAGTVAIGLPFLEEMLWTREALAAETPTVPRLVTIFFPLGVPRRVLDQGFDSPAMEPLQAFRNKASLLREVDYVEVNGHQSGSGHCFTGFSPPSRDRAGGDSIDQVALAAYAQQFPEQDLQGLHVAMQAYRNREGMVRLANSWKNGGETFEMPFMDPQELFTELFGSATPSEDRAQIRGSILDSVRAQAGYLVSDRSSLGAASKRKVSDYLDEVRSLERSIQDHLAECREVGAPPDIPELTLENWHDRIEERVDLLTELFVLGLRCDPRRRFGTIGLGAGGEHWNIPIDGTTYNCHHDIHHDGREQFFEPMARRQLEMVGRVLQKFDAYEDEPGKTLLDNTLVLVSSELGDHSRGHNCRQVFHLAAGLDGAIAHDTVIDDSLSSVEVYSTCLRALGIDRVHGRPDHFDDLVGGLLDQPLPML